ncbi:MAG TPA: phenylalanine--tRNA ligase subunit alpha [Firmicutes bacterium]|nr:phenylalanine--tRNA ligase subunit alpha [Bacillota bacterium]
MREQLQALESVALEAVSKAADLEELNNLRVRFLGKKGELTAILRGMATLSAEERPIIGQLANELRSRLENSLAEKTAALATAAKQARLAAEEIDITLPGRPFEVGHQHLITRTLEEIQNVFLGMGFSLAEGPEVETDYYNFEALNVPADHPARDMQDSFYFGPELLLRTHTSPMQVRTMEKLRPQPVRIIAAGRVYRRDDDATHSPMFHQVEGLVVDANITLADLKGVLLTFARAIFGEEREIRLRPSFFPFTEPSAEVDISCFQCGGSGCRLCKGSGWIEILGSGLVHPRVLELSGYDPEQVSGFAFGMGVERIAMLKYGLDDLRHLFTNDMRFLRQF